MKNLLTPVQFLKTFKSEKVRIVLKWNMHYDGTLIEYDDYFNIVLRDAVEYVEHVECGRIDEIAIRCNNVKMIEEIL